ncbi:hypothetical protein Ddc_24702 [Ditylenchus destructor]|nr:hypothetical protein Ddc_24702 [Ditylenchus destructor]
MPDHDSNGYVLSVSDGCDKAKDIFGLTTWLPPTSVKCQCVFSGNEKCTLEVIKWINVFEEKQIHGTEKVLEHRKISWPRSYEQGKQTMVKGSTIWNKLGLTDSDILRTHKDPNKGKEITFDSKEDFAVETLDSLYITRKETKVEEEGYMEAKTETNMGEKLVPKTQSWFPNHRAAKMVNRMDSYDPFLFPHSVFTLVNSAHPLRRQHWFTKSLV